MRKQNAVACNPIRRPLPEVSRRGQIIWAKIFFQAVRGQDEGTAKVLDLNLELKDQESHLQFEVKKYENSPNLLFKSIDSGNETPRVSD